MQRYNSTAGEQQTLLKTGAGRLSSVLCHNGNGSTRYLQIYDIPRTVEDEATPEDFLVAIIPIEAGQSALVPFNSGERIGLEMHRGIALANSTTAQSYTAGSADSWFTALFE